MSNIINLNHVKKGRTKAKKQQQANENRIKFGRTKSEKNLIKTRQKIAEKLLDNHQKPNE
ncbi:MAG: DUF4169 family protein [Devosiaceae bacterium]|nr:DUF4169 family protein [Devosiaceae bacterium]